MTRSLHPSPIKNYTKGQTEKQTDICTSQLLDWIGFGADSVQIYANIPVNGLHIVKQFCSLFFEMEIFGVSCMRAKFCWQYIAIHGINTKTKTNYNCHRKPVVKFNYKFNRPQVGTNFSVEHFQFNCNT